MSQEVSKWLMTYLYMGYIGVITHLLTIYEPFTKFQRDIQVDETSFNPHPILANNSGTSLWFQAASSKNYPRLSAGNCML